MKKAKRCYAQALIEGALLCIDQNLVTWLGNAVSMCAGSNGEVEEVSVTHGPADSIFTRLSSAQCKKQFSATLPNLCIFFT